MRLGCNRSKIDLALHTGLRFRHRASIYRCRDYLPEVVSAPLKFWAPVPKFFQDRYVYTAITGSAVPKNCQYGAKILGCRANFLVRVNGVRRCHRRQARENTCERVTIGFGLSSDWLRKWHEFCQPITGRGKTKPKQTRITFDTAEFTIRYARVLRRALSPPPSRMEGEVKRDVNWFEI